MSTLRHQIRFYFQSNQSHSQLEFYLKNCQRWSGNCAFDVHRRFISGDRHLHSRNTLSNVCDSVRKFRLSTHVDNTASNSGSEEMIDHDDKSFDGVDRDSKDDYFNVTFDDDSLELPPNPDIPPPKVRTQYPIVAQQEQQQQRGSRQNNLKQKNRNDSISSLSNERLVARIVENIKRRRINGNSKNRSSDTYNGGRNQQNINADTIQVRVIPDPLMAKSHHDEAKRSNSNTLNDQNDNEITDSNSQSKPQSESKKNDKKPITMIISLAEAIQMSIAQEKDLVEVSIDQDIPVVTISKVTSMAYQNIKAKKSLKVSTAAASQVKEITMQAGIADNDLQRKVNEILKFVDKGYSCIVTIRATTKATRVNENAASITMERVLVLIRDKVEMVVEPEINIMKTIATFRVRASKKK